MAVRQITYDELCARLQPWACKRLNYYRSGLEYWETGWRSGFTLKSDDGVYDDWQCDEIIEKVIRPTMPQDWKLI
jgi:hypothetical protein